MGLFCRAKDFGLRANGSVPRANRFKRRIEHFRARRVGAKKGASELWMSEVPFRSLFPMVESESLKTSSDEPQIEVESVSGELRITIPTTIRVVRRYKHVIAARSATMIVIVYVCAAIGLS